jgi:pimeloyl-ACP methyl ester carboxylesterase
MRFISLVLSGALLVSALWAQPNAALAQQEKKIELKSEYADVNGVRLHYLTAGEGPLIIFVHGFYNFSYYWKDQLEEFAKDHKVVAYDQRGYNLSSRPTDLEKYKMNHLVEDLRQLAVKLNGNKKFILVGHDWGGLVTYAFTMYHPEMVDKLIQTNAAHLFVSERELRKNPWQRHAANYALVHSGFGTPEEMAKDLTVIDKAEATRRANRPGSWLDNHVKSGHYTEADRQKWIDAWSQPGAYRAARDFYKANHRNPPFNSTHPANTVPASWSAEAVTRGAKSIMIQVPTAVLWGIRDGALPVNNLTGLDEWITDLRVKMFPEDGHDLSAVNYKGFNQAMRAFLNGTLPRESVFNPKELEGTP